MFKRKLAALTFALAFVMQLPAVAKDHGVTSSILIEAPQDAVWEGIRDTKNFDDKIQSDVPNEAVVEQKFHLLPLIGETSVTLKATTIPKRTVDLSLIHSNHLKAFTGRFEVTPISPTETRLEMSLYVDTGLPVPQFVVNGFVAGKVRSRLQKVKAVAEASARAATCATASRH